MFEARLGTWNEHRSINLLTAPGLWALAATTLLALDESWWPTAMVVWWCSAW